MSLERRTRFWVEIVLAAISCVLLVLTLVWRHWIEAVFRVDPDNHSGYVEWLVVAALLSSTIVFAILARTESRRLNTSLTSA